jgi:hypothetical protein
VYRFLACDSPANAVNRFFSVWVPLISGMETTPFYVVDPSGTGSALGADSGQIELDFEDRVTAFIRGTTCEWLRVETDKIVQLSAARATDMMMAAYVRVEAPPVFPAVESSDPAPANELVQVSINGP